MEIEKCIICGKECFNKKYYDEYSWNSICSKKCYIKHINNESGENDEIN